MTPNPVLVPTDRQRLVSMTTVLARGTTQRYAPMDSEVRLCVATKSL